MIARRFLAALLLVSALPTLLFAQKPSGEYASLLAALKAGNTSVDYTRLRLSYADSPERKAAKDTSDAETRMIASINAKDFTGALTQAETVLDAEYVNLDAHFAAFIANRELGNAEKSGFHRAVFRGLLDSIRNSGDGKTTETAWVVISVHEEYVMLRVLGFKPSGQALLHKDGHSYDEMKVKSAQDGSEQTLYFNVDIPFSHYGF
jgi:hypothetical protein